MTHALIFDRTCRTKLCAISIKPVAIERTSCLVDLRRSRKNVTRALVQIRRAERIWASGSSRASFTPTCDGSRAARAGACRRDVSGTLGVETTTEVSAGFL